MATHNDFGKEAEELAVNFLEKKGYQILARNFRYLKAEVDIIAKWENTIIIVEVKARSYSTVIEPQDAVNKKKIKLLISAADYFITEQNRDEEVRFDIISVLPDAKGKLQIQHIENAFEIIDFQ